jgi:hypothetical protein
MKVDSSTLSIADAFNIALQRTEQLRLHLSFRLWTRGLPQLLFLEAAFRKRAIIQGALQDIEKEFNVIAKCVGERNVSSIVDIGCGQAFIDLFFWRRFKCMIHLIDIESSDNHHHGFYSSGAGYASLRSAKNFLVKNNVPADKIRLTNPKQGRPFDSNCDIIISLLSCGYHYPVETYQDFINSSLLPGGLFIFDMRKNSNQDHYLDRFARHDVIGEDPSYLRIAAVNRY